MRSRTIVGVLGLAALLGVAVYLLLQVPAEFAIGGIVALAAILLALGVDAPDQL
jgi:hypothetical protein